MTSADQLLWFIVTKSILWNLDKECKLFFTYEGSQQQIVRALVLFLY